MRLFRHFFAWLCLCLAPFMPAVARAADVIGNILEIDAGSRSMVLRTDQRWDGIHSGDLGEVWSIAMGRGVRFYKVPPGQDLARVAGNPGKATASAFEQLAVGDRVLVRGERRQRAMAADVVVDEGLSYWIMHQHVAGAWSPGEISVVGPLVYYSEGKHSFVVGCAEFVQGARRNGADGPALTVPGAPAGGFWDPAAGNGEAVGAIQKGIDEACSVALRKQAAAAAEQARIQAELDARFRSGVIDAWRAADEAEPFASIRGEADSTNSAWAARIQLPGADRCVLIKTGGTAATSLWTFECRFRGDANAYPGIVKSVQSALHIVFRPDEAAVSVNRVFFSDSSKPAWRLVVTGMGNASQVVLQIMPRELADKMPDR